MHPSSLNAEDGAHGRTSKVGAVLRVTSGNFLEQFDFELPLKFRLPAGRV
jgi:MHS family citrate/tricarballylate:H+ symporter-like MFS transporter